MIRHFYKTGLKTFVTAGFCFLFQYQAAQAQCPRIEAVLVNACGQEEDNEFVIIHSGNGFNTSNLQLSFPAAANSGGAVNDDININLGNQGPTPCGLIPGKPALIGGCTNVTPVGLGVDIPANAILVLQTSAGADATYDFSALCGNGECIYVMANACDRSVPAFAQTGVGTRQIILQLNGGTCTQTIDYNIANGNFVTNGGYYLPLTDQYGNNGCVAPPSSPAPRKPDIASFTNIASCGPYQLPPIPGTGITANAAYFTGPDRTGTKYVAGDLITMTTTLYAHDFAGGCFDQEMFTVTISGGTAPVATISGGGVSCEGVGVNLNFNITGTPPFIVQYTANAVPQTSILVPTNSAVLPVMPSVTTTYELTSVVQQAGGCIAQVSGQAVVTITPAPTAVISGGGPICSGDSAVINVALTGQAPFQLVLAVDGVSQPAVTVPGNTYTFKVSPGGNTSYTVFSVRGADNCRGPLAGFQSGEALVTLAQAPTALLSDGAATLCSGQEASIDVDLTGTGPFTFVYAIDNVAQPAVTTSDPQYTIMDTQPPGTYTYELVSVASNGCQGTVSGSFALTVLDTPTATISGDSTTCLGRKVPLQINFTGAPPYQFAIVANGVQGPTQVWGDPVFPFEPIPNGPTRYQVTAFSANGCTGTSIGSVDVKIVSPPTASITGDTTYCIGGTPGRLLVTFQGVGPYTFVYSINNGAQASITTSQNPHIIPITPSSGTIYRLVSVSNGGCTGTVSGLVFTRIFTRPTVLLRGDTTVCNSGSTRLDFNFTGTGPFTVAYSANGIAQPPFTTQDDPYFLPVMADSTIRYVIDSLKSPGCLGVQNGTATITVNKPPVADTATLTCNPNNIDYVVTFKVLNGTPPYTLVSGAGTFSGNQFTSAPLLRTDNYSFTFRDANNCGDITISGLPNCSCATQAGLMSQTPVTACETDMVVVPAVSGQVMDNNDVVRYVLQSNPGLPLGTVYAWSDQPRFSKQAGMLTNTTYYISAVVGNPGPANEVDATDPCRAVAMGTPVLFHGKPTATLGIVDTNICQNQPLTLTVNFTGTAPFSFQAKNFANPLPKVSNINAPTYTWTLMPAQNARITIDSVSDRFCKAGIGLDTADIKVWGKPTLTNINEQCDFNTGTYVLSFDVSVGLEPFTVSGVTGTFTGKQFVSNPILFGTPYSLTVRDQFNCGDATLNGAGICKCTTNAGSMASTVLKDFCVNTNASATHNGNQSLANGDGLRFVLHTSAVDTLGTVLATANTPSFAFNPATLQIGTTYYISAVAGRLLNGSFIPNHPCLSVAPGTPVRWLAVPTAALTGNFDICPGETEVLTLNFTGEPPFNFTYTQNNGPAIVGNALQNTYDISATLIETTTFTLVSVSNAGCTGTVQGSAMVTVHEKPEIANLMTSCNLDGDAFVLTLNVDGLDAGNTPAFTGNITGTYNPTGNLFVSVPFPSQTPYTITVRDTLWGCGEATATGIVTCPCVTSAGTLPQTPLQLCAGAPAILPVQTDLFLAPKDTIVYALATGTNPATWTLVATSTSLTFPFNPATMSTGTPYFIVAVAGNKGGAFGVDPADPCVSLAIGPSVVWRPAPSVALADSLSVCQGDTLEVTLQFVGTAPFNFTLTGGGAPQNLSATANSFVLKLAPAASTNYNITNLQGGGGCPGTVDGELKVAVRRRPDIVNRTAVCAPDNETYVVEFDVANAELDAASIGITGTNTGTYNPVTGHFTSDPIPAFTPYDFKVSGLLQNCGEDTIQGISACKCITNAGTLDQAPLALCPGTIATISPATGVVLDGKDTLVYALTTAPNQPNWTVLSTSPIPSFVFDPATMQTGVAYYIIAIAGNKMGTGVDISDPCYAVAFGPTVTWRVAPMATIMGVDSICAGDSTSLSLAFTGDGPYSFTLNTGNGNLQNYTTDKTTLQLSVQPLVSTTYSVLNLSGSGGCPGAANGNVSIFVRALPSAVLRGDTSVCPGSAVAYPVSLTGTGPFEMVYALNGTSLPAVTSNQTTYTLNIPNIQQNQQATLVSVRDAFCTGTVDGTLSVAVLDAPRAALQADETICEGDSVVLRLQLSGADTFNLTIGGGPTPFQVSNALNGSTLTVTPALTTTYTITTAQSLGNVCPVQIGPAITVSVKSLKISATVSDYSGYNVSCADAADGSISLIVIGGGAGLNIQWSNGSSQPRIDNLSAGSYTVTVTDPIGCTQRENYILREPPGLDLQLNTSAPTCFESSDGTITIDGIRGGIGPYTLLVDNRLTLRLDTFPFSVKTFESGNYAVSVEDTKGCITDTLLTVDAAPELKVDLGPDVSISFGDSLTLNALTSYPVDTFIWSPVDFLKTPTALSTELRPPQTIRYKILVRDAAGCQAADDVMIKVERNPRIFVPNTFNPESDTENGILTIYSGAEVKQIPQFRIYDRWGNSVFERFDFQPNDPSLGWDGRWRGKKVNPGVFVYLLEVEYFDGTKESLKGDITVLR